MWHPFIYCPLRHCCCCLCDSEVTCFVIATIGIVHNVFGGIINFGVGHWTVYAFSISAILVQLIACTLLILGTLWGNVTLKVFYCWLSFIMILLVAGGCASYTATYKEDYLIWYNVFNEEDRQHGGVYVIPNTVWLILWNIYTPMVVAGNMGDEYEF